MRTIQVACRTAGNGHACVHAMRYGGPMTDRPFSRQVRMAAYMHAYICMAKIGLLEPELSRVRATLQRLQSRSRPGQPLLELQADRVNLHTATSGSHAATSISLHALNADFRRMVGPSTTAAHVVSRLCSHLHESPLVLHTVLGGAKAHTHYARARVDARDAGWHGVRVERWAGRPGVAGAVCIHLYNHQRTPSVRR